MAVRPIDANAMLSELRPVSFEAEHSAVLLSDVSKMMREWVERQPTLTPPNEAPPCYQPDGDGCAYQCYDGQDEPIEKCKECPLCYSDKQRQHTPPNEPMTQADLDSMNYDKVWIDYGDDGEWALVVNGRIYCLTVLEGAGFEDILRDEVGGETMDRPSGDYTVYRRPPEGEA